MTRDNQFPIALHNQYNSIRYVDIEHDPIIVPRAVVVVESMAALVILDALLASMTTRMDRIKSFFLDR